jgi:hypothetical protein
MLHITTLNTKNEEGYREFLANVPDSLIYATLEYRNFLMEVLPGEPHYLIACSGQDIVGALPCFRCFRKGVGTVINSLPWYGSHGACIVLPGREDDVRESLLVAYWEMATAVDVLTATLILSPFENDQVDLYRKILCPQTLDYRIGQITHLPEPGPDLAGRLEKTLTQKTRNLIRKSLKQGFRLENHDDLSAWQFLYETHQENMAAINGRAKPWTHFLELRERLPKGWRTVSLAFLDDIPVAALLLLHYNFTVEYFTPVIKFGFRSLQPLSFLIWHGMLQAAERGYQRWNWGGTWLNQTSLHHFKAGWGARDYPYTYLVNAREENLPRMNARVEDLMKEFPFYFIYPFAQLRETHASKS